MNTDKVITITVQLFAKYGIKTVSMDMISAQLKMSKKTLYELFTDKEDMVNKCMHSAMVRIVSFTGQMEKYSDSPLEKLIAQSVISYGYISSFCPAFYRDIEKYPHACEMVERYSRTVVAEHKSILNSGIKMGFFSENTNSELILKLLVDMVLQMREVPRMQRISITDFFYMTTTVLKGVCTKSGSDELERIRVKWDNSNMLDKLAIREDNI